MSVPSRRMLPVSPGNMPLMASKSTVLPEPVRPRMAKISPHLDGKGDGRQCKTASFYGKIVDNQLVHRMNTCLLFLSAGLASRRERKRVSPEIISISMAVAMAAWLSPVDMLR